MRVSSAASVVAAVSLAVGCAPSGPPPEKTADAIYASGKIVTMDPARPSAEAVAVKDGKILAVGMRAEVEKAHKGASTKVVDLGGRTLLPGFVDAHSHLKNVGLQALSANLLPPPDGTVTSIADLEAKLREFEKGPVGEKLGWIVGFGYDDSQLAEKRHPTRDDLDAVSKDKPVIVIHQSGHLYVANSKLLEMAGISAKTPDPPGGVVRRGVKGEPDGVLEETAGMLVLPVFPKLKGADQRLMVRKGLEAYARFGFTTAQEGRAFPSDLALYKEMAENGELSLDVVAYPDFWLAHGTLKGDPWLARTYKGHFRIGGVKGNLDGSPQGKTAWLTKPYVVPPEGKTKEYAGYGMLKDDQALAMYDEAYANGWQIITHANGDAAIDQLIRAARAATAKYGKADRRSVGVHSQTIREDQLDAYKELGIIPSLFGMHTFYWGDWHRDSVLGPERASRISPAKSVLDRGMIFTQHSDAPVALPNSIAILATQVNRTTRSGQVLGPEQRVSAENALRSITTSAAYQYFEEKTKGSITPGKLADFVVLDRNPLEVEPKALWDLQVVETIKEGKTVFSR
ncbi:MAG: amidohydrolase [Thermoanaerobaculia bacterium]